jgi:hypothetical protein
MGREDDPGRTQEIPFLDNRASGAKAHVCGWPLGSIGTFERVGGLFLTRVSSASYFRHPRRTSRGGVSKCRARGWWPS